MIWDAVIIGAGPAGCQAAWHLHAAGKRVLLLDRRTFPRHKSCGGMLSPAAVDLLPFNIMKVARGIGRATLMRAADGSYRTSQAQVFLTHRPEFDAFFLRFVVSAGIPFRQIPRINRVKSRDDYCDLHTVNHELIRARWVIAADGSNSAMRRLLCPDDAMQIALAMEADVKVHANLRHCPVGFDFTEINDGYAWYFPKGDMMNIGLCTFFSPRLDRNVLVRILSRFGPDAASAGIHGAPLSTFRGDARLGHGRVLFVGDAAGLVDPVSGEGIREALLSGRECALSLLAAPNAPEPEYAGRLTGLLEHLVRKKTMADAQYRDHGALDASALYS